MKKNNLLFDLLLTLALFLLPFLYPLYALYGNKVKIDEFIIESFNIIYKNYGAMFALVILGIILILLSSWMFRRSKYDLDEKVKKIQLEISNAKTKEELKKLKRKLIINKLLFNAFSYWGVFWILISEYYLFGAIFLIGAFLAFEVTKSLSLGIGVGILLVFLTYNLIYFFIKWLFSKISFWRFDFKGIGYLESEDEDIILNWSKVVGALLFIYAVVLTMISLLDINIGEDATTAEIINAVFTDNTTTLTLLLFTIIH